MAWPPTIHKLHCWLVPHRVLFIFSGRLYMANILEELINVGHFKSLFFKLPCFMRLSLVLFSRSCLSLLRLLEDSRSYRYRRSQVFRFAPTAVGGWYPLPLWDVLLWVCGGLFDGFDCSFAWNGFGRCDVSPYLLWWINRGIWFWKNFVCLDWTIC